MPYCPKCDMEFIDGITVCSDCGGPLVASKEIADAVKKKEQEETAARRQAEFEAMQAAWEAELAARSEASQESAREEEDSSKPADYMKREHAEPALAAKFGYAPVRTRTYVKKSQQYEDLKSSASAFLIVGGVLLVFAALCWANVIRLPMAGFSRILSQSVMTLMGAASLVVAFTSTKSAKEVSSQVEAEEQVTRQLIDWFTANYTGEQLDQQLSKDFSDLGPEEWSLKRFELIQDILITNHDIADQAYADMLSDEIYSRLYES